MLKSIIVAFLSFFLLSCTTTTKTSNQETLLKQDYLFQKRNLNIDKNCFDLTFNKFLEQEEFSLLSSDVSTGTYESEAMINNVWLLDLKKKKEERSTTTTVKKAIGGTVAVSGVLLGSALLELSSFLGISAGSMMAFPILLVAGGIALAKSANKSSDYSKENVEVRIIFKMKFNSESKPFDTEIAYEREFRDEKTGDVYGREMINEEEVYKITFNKLNSLSKLCYN